MAQSGTVALKSFQSFMVNDGLLGKVVEAVKAGEKEARSTGNIQTFEVFYKGFRQNIAIGRVMVIPAKVADSREDFPIALLYGCLMRQFGGEEMADLLNYKIGDSEFDEYSKADLAALKDKIFKNEEGKYESLILFAPHWWNKREYIAFKFTKDDEKLANMLRHLVFSAYFDPRLSSAFNALMTDVSTDKLDVTNITPKLNIPGLAENPLKEYPVLDKMASVNKKVFLTFKTAAGIEQSQIEPEELNVFEALNTAVERALGVEDMKDVATHQGSDKKACGEMPVVQGTNAGQGSSVEPLPQGNDSLKVRDEKSKAPIGIELNADGTPKREELGKEAKIAGVRDAKAVLKKHGFEGDYGKPSRTRGWTFSHPSGNSVYISNGWRGVQFGPWGRYGTWIVNPDSDQEQRGNDAAELDKILAEKLAAPAPGTPAAQPQQLTYENAKQMVGSKELVGSPKTARDRDEHMKYKGHDFHLRVWQERDNFSITLMDDSTDTELGYWSDDNRGEEDSMGEASQMFEDGFFNSRNLIGSVVEYLESVGALNDIQPMQEEEEWDESHGEHLEPVEGYTASSKKSREAAAKHVQRIAKNEIRQHIAEEAVPTSDNILDEVLTDMGQAPAVDLPGEASPEGADNRTTTPEAQVPAEMKSEMPEETKAESQPEQSATPFESKGAKKKAHLNDVMDLLEGYGRFGVGSKLGSSVAEDIAEAKSEIDFDKNDIADNDRAENPSPNDLFGEKIAVEIGSNTVQCIDCGSIGEPTREGRCDTCGSDAVTRKIHVNPDEPASEASKVGGERNDDVPVAKGETESGKQPVSDLAKGAPQPEAHDVSPLVDKKVAGEIYEMYTLREGEAEPMGSGTLEQLQQQIIADMNAGNYHEGEDVVAVRQGGVPDQAEFYLGEMDEWMPIEREHEASADPTSFDVTF